MRQLQPVEHNTMDGWICRIMREEKCEESKTCMLDYLIALLDEANDFSWQSAKASHAVLLCRIEQGEISNWSETDKIDRVRRANAQRHTNGYQSSASYHKSKFQGQTQAQGLTQAKVTKTMPCVYYNDWFCSHQKHHETRGVYCKHICSTCFAHGGKSSAHSAVECRQKNLKKRISLGMAFGNKGPAQDKLTTSSSSYAYSSRIINCRNKGTVSQYGAPSRVWKQWLSMSNMCKPVDPRRSFAEVLKTCPSKHENTSSLMPRTCKSKVTTLSKAQVHQVPNKVTSPGQGKSPCVHKSVYRGHTVDPVSCYNRFDPLKQFDTQELDDQTENWTVGQTGHKVKSKVKLTKHSNVQTPNVHKLVQQDINS